MIPDGPGRERGLAGDGSAPEGVLREADELLDAERYHAALALLRGAARGDPAVAGRRAAAYAGLAEFGRAADAVREALAADPDEAHALAVAGYMVDVVDRAPAEAMELLRRAVAADRRSAYVHYRLGEFLLRHEQVDHARAALEEAWVLGARNWRIALALSRFAATPRERAALALAARREGLRRNPGDPRLRLGLLWALLTGPLALAGGASGPLSTEAARRQHLALQALFSRPFRPVVTWAILGVNTVMFAILEWQGGWQDPQPDALVGFGAMAGPYLAHGEWWRLLTPLVLHASLVHFAMNSLFLWVMGPMTERLFGHSRMLLLYVLAGVCGNLASYLHNPMGLSVGASTALFGLLGALGVFFGRSRGLLGTFGRRQFQSIVVTAVLNLVFDLAVPLIDTAAHVGGLIGGLVVGAILLPQYALDDGESGVPALRDRRRPTTLVAGTVALVVVLCALIKLTVYG